MASLHNQTRDYVVGSLDTPFDPDLWQAVLMRLNAHRGKYWANPNLGSRFYLMRRSKDVTRHRIIAKQYADEALADLIPTRVAAITTIATQSQKSRIDLNVEITKLTGDKQSIIYFVKVGS